MLPNPTLEKLQTLRLHGMIKALSEQHATPDINDLSFVELRLAASGNQQFGTLAGECFGDGEAKARRTTSDQNNFVFKRHGKYL